jgi:GNAT superfamily N-acetyltransferase
VNGSDGTHDHPQGHGHAHPPARKGEGRAGSAAEVTLRDDGLAQRALRVGVSPRALIVHLGTDVVVRTPTRPGQHDGNVVDLLAPPRPEDVPALVERVERAMTPLGVRHVHVRFELPVDERPEPALTAALTAQRLELAWLRAMELAVVPDGASDPAAVAGLAVERLPAPSADGTVTAVDRRWHAAAVLDRYAVGDDVPTWRDWDEEDAAWARATVRELALLGRAEVWLASRHGMPVATLTVVRDLDGIAVVQDLVTHPTHRRRGVATALLTAVIRDHRARRPDERFLATVAPGSEAERFLAGRGMRPVADVCLALRPERRPG